MSWEAERDGALESIEELLPAQLEVWKSTPLAQLRRDARHAPAATHPAVVVPDAQARLLAGNRELYDEVEAASASPAEAFVTRSYTRRSATRDA